MRSLAVLTTTAAISLMGVASAETANAPPAAAPADNVQSAMGAYAAYQMDISDLRTRRMTDADALEQAIDKASSHSRDGLTRGWIAYGAGTAAQSPAFVQGVRDAAAYYGRDAVIWALTADSSYARGLRGGPEATALVLAAANADGARIASVADRYQEMAYSLQRQRWASAVAPGQAARVQRVRTLTAAGSAGAAISDISPRLAVTPASLSPGADPTAFGGRHFWDSLRSNGAQVVEAANPVTYRFRVDAPRGEAVNRMMTIGALEALNATGERAAAVDTLMNEPRTKDCITMAQLQLFQCMSAARFRYENAFCLSQHAMRDVGACFSAVARPDTAAMTPIPARTGG
ncbi:MAG: hypothetical protein AB7L65_05270 [Hyphomonadaceae bacterium]